MPSITQTNVLDLTSVLQQHLTDFGIDATDTQIREAIAWSQNAKNFADLKKHLPLALDASDEAQNRFNEYMESVAVINFGNGLKDFPDFTLENILASIPGTTRVAPAGKSFGIAINWTNLEKPISYPFIIHNSDLFDGKIRNDETIFLFSDCFLHEEWRALCDEISELVETACAGYTSQGPRQEPVFNQSAAIAFAEVAEYFERRIWRDKLKPLDPRVVAGDCSQGVFGRSDLQLARLAFNIAERCSHPCDSSSILAELKTKRDLLNNKKASIPVPAWLHRIKDYLS